MECFLYPITCCVTVGLPFAWTLSSSLLPSLSLSSLLVSSELLLSTSLLLRTAGTHAQNRQGSQGDQLRHLHLRAICTCAPSACSSSSRKGSASRSRSSCGGSACSRTRERAARRRPVDLGMPFLQGFVFHMVPVRVKSNYYSFYRLGSASETVRRCATAAPRSLSFLFYCTPV